MKTRCYCIVNQYIAGLHAGIQSAHAIGEMAMSLRGDDYTATASEWYEQWLCADKTIIVLDGGYQSNLENLYELMHVCKSYPHGRFYEEKEALNGALTALAIVLPEYMYAPQYATELEGPVFGGIAGLKIANKFKDLVTGNVLHNYTQPEKNLIEAIKALRLKNV